MPQEQLCKTHLGQHLINPTHGKPDMQEDEQRALQCVMYTSSAVALTSTMCRSENYSCLLTFC